LLLPKAARMMSAVILTSGPSDIDNV